MIFNILCLINDLHSKIQVLISLQIPFQKVIGSDQNFPFSRIFYQCFSLPHIPCHNSSRKPRSKTFDLAHPVKHQRCRSYHKRTPVFPRRRFQEFRPEKCDHLKRFSKSHVVCKNSTKPIMFQSFDPAKSLFLITTENFFLLWRNLKFVIFHCLHVSDQCTEPPVFLHPDQIAAFQLAVQIHGTVSRYLGPAFFQFTVTDLQAVF